MKCSKKLLIFLSSFMLCVGDLCSSDNQNPAQVKTVTKESLASGGNDSPAGENTNWTISLTTEYRDELDVKSIYEFTSDNYSYYLTTERKSATPASPYISKIKRVCYTPGKSAADEYSEILIECAAANGTYNLVQAAHVGKPGLKSIKSLKIRPEDEALFATFSKSKTSDSNEPTTDSAICIYSLDVIKRKFTEKIRNCFNSVVNTELDLVLRENKCVGTISTVNIDTECIRGVKSVPFDGNELIRNSPLLTFSALPTDIISARKKHRNFIFIGTSDGYVKTFIVNDAESLPYVSGDQQIDNSSVNFDPQLSSDESFVLKRITMSGTKAYRVPEIPCQIFTTYDSCLQSDIELCGWCGFSNQCTKKLECEKEQNDAVGLWLDYDFRKNTTIIQINSRSFERTSGENIEMTIMNIPTIRAQFKCSFEIRNENYTTSLTLDETNATCSTPSANKLSTIPLDYDHLNATLRIETKHITNIASINITFFDCRTYNSCDKCVYSSSNLKCDWYIANNMCRSGYQMVSKNKHENVVTRNNSNCPAASTSGKPTVDTRRSNECNTDDDCETHEACLKSLTPSISSINPVKGPCEGGTNLAILGENLGCTFEDISRSIIKVAGIPCTPLKENYIPMKMIVCNIYGSNLHENLEGPVELLLNEIRLKSHQNFKFVNSKINDVSPNQGFIYGGTELTFEGEHLDAGRFVDISVANTPCMLIYRSPIKMKCITDPSEMAKEGEIIVKFDNNIRKPNNSSYKYIEDVEHDENGYNTAPKGILSGGVEILIRNITFTRTVRTRELQFLVHINNTNHYKSSCKVRNDSTATCLSPHIPDIDHSSLSAQNPLRLEFSLKHQTENVRIIFNNSNSTMKFTLFPDPEFFHFLNSSVTFNDKTYIIIKGRNINLACQKSDMKVKIGNDICTVISLSSSQVICSLPKSQSNEEYDILTEIEYIKVLIGNHFNQIVPKQQAAVKNIGREICIVSSIIGVIAIFCMIALILCIYHFHYHRKTSVKNTLELRKMQQHMNQICIESMALKQSIKQVIIEKQIELDKDLSNILKLPNISIVDAEDSRPTAITSSDTEYLLPFDGEWEFPRENLSLGNDLGEGEFGKVVQAEALGILQKTLVTTVAVKMLKDVHSDEDMIDLVSEMEIMKLIGAHVNVLQLLGCCSQDGELLIITEFATHGNLRDFLRAHLHSAKNKHILSHLSQSTLLMFAQQAAKGMEYLATKKCVHRDLAARNVLVSNNYIIKIADFGLARDIRNKDYYRKEAKGRLPLKWMAPEALSHGLYSTQSDVWSYGVLVWEILTLGATPYPSFPDLGKLFQALHSGYRMEKPPNCSVKLYSLMHKCWSYVPEDRPSFTMIANALEDTLSKNANDEGLQRCTVYWPQRHECSSSDVENLADVLHE